MPKKADDTAVAEEAPQGEDGRWTAYDHARGSSPADGLHPKTDEPVEG